MTEEQWKKIVESSGLPPEARDDVERAIDWFRFLLKESENRLKTGEKNRDIMDTMDRVSAELFKSLTDLRDMQNDRDVFLAVAEGGGANSSAFNDDQRKAWQQRLSHLVDELELGLEWWDESKRRLALLGAGRPNESNDLHRLFRQLSFITNEYVRKRTSLSKKHYLNFLKAVCIIADERFKEKDSLSRDVAWDVMREDKQFFESAD